MSTQRLQNTALITGLSLEKNTSIMFLKYTNQFTKKGKFINDIFPRGYTCFKNILKKISVLINPYIFNFLKSLLYS